MSSDCIWCDSPLGCTKCKHCTRKSRRHKIKRFSRQEGQTSIHTWRCVVCGVQAPRPNATLDDPLE